MSIADEIPFEIPDSWEWVRLNTVMTLYNGRAYKQQELLQAGKYPVLRVGNLFTNNSWYYSDLELEENKYVETGDLIYAWSASFGPFVWNGEKCIFHYHIWKMEYSHQLYREYLYYFLLSETASIKAGGHGLSMQHVTKEGMEQLLIPIPPYREQIRIVEQLQKIEPYLNKYSVIEKEINELNTNFPDQLKKSILQLAVQGKLVPQDPNGEPASVLLEKIHAEKERLIKEGKIKRDKNESIIFRRDNSHYEKFGKIERCIDAEIPFEIPDTWGWARLGAISTYASTKSKVNASKADKSIWGLDLEDIEKGGRLLVKKTVGERKAIGDKTCFSKGEILYSKLRPYLLKVLIADDDGICTPEIVPFSMYGSIATKYIVNYLKSPYVDSTINAATYGIKMPRAGTETMTNLLVPIPPINEQYRIVQTIEELFPYCDKL